MKIDHEKVGDGVKGSAGKLAVGGNNYSQLPKSSMSGFNIDEDVIAGRSTAVSGSRATGQNVGEKQGQSSNKNVGIDDDVATGTVSATENFGGYGPAPDKRGQFGLSARGGSRTEGSTAATLGSGARASGTAAGSGTPGRGGSMELARRGLSGSESGGDPVGTLPRRASNKSIVDSKKGLKRSGKADIDD